MGGGGCRRLCADTHITKPEVPYGRANKRALEALGFLMLSCAIWAYFEAFWYKMGFLKKSVDQSFSEGEGVLHPHLDPPLYKDI